MGVAMLRILFLCPFAGLPGSVEGYVKPLFDPLAKRANRTKHLIGMKVPQSTTPADLCSQIRCTRAANYKHGYCRGQVLCGGCEDRSSRGGALPVEQHCSNLEGPDNSMYKLNFGFAEPTGVIRPGGERVVELTWEDAGDLDLNLCAPEKFDLNQYIKRMAMASPMEVFRPVVIRVVMSKVQKQVVKSNMKLTAYLTSGPRVKYGECKNLTGRDTFVAKPLADGQSLAVVARISVPISLPVTAANFVVKVGCEGKLKECDLANVRFCATILCDVDVKKVGELLGYQQFVEQMIGKKPQPPQPAVAPAAAGGGEDEGDGLSDADEGDESE